MAVDSNNQIVIDPRFFVPPGAVDMRQADLSNYQASYTPTTTAVQGPILNKPSAKVPMPPTSYQVVDQHVRVSADGSTVVDVTVEFPDIPGVNSIDVRVTKAT